jgi:hypothetical protein
MPESQGLKPSRYESRKKNRAPSTTVTLAGSCEFGVKAVTCRPGATFAKTMTSASLRALRPSTWARTAGAAVLLVLVAACGSLPGSGMLPPPPSPPTDALVPWQGFPADRVPRPIVLLDDLPMSPGFSNNDGKTATVCHRFAPPAHPLPSDVPANTTSSWADGTVATYGAISASDAYAAMSIVPVSMKGAQCDAAIPLAATGGRLGTFGFNTDRGTAQMSAWLFAFPGALGEIAYPAIAESAFWSKVKTMGFFGGGMTVSADGLVLNFWFYGAPSGSGPCDASYTAAVAESTSAVAIAIQITPAQAQSGDVACPAIAQSRSVTVRLARPLGGRVVIDASGQVIAVCPASMPAIPGSPRC